MKDERTPIYHIGLIKKGNTIRVQATDSVDGLSCEIQDYLGRRQCSKKTMRKDKELLLEGLKALPKYRNCTAIVIEEPEGTYIPSVPSEWEKATYLEHVQRCLTKLNNVMHEFNEVWGRDERYGLDLNDYLSTTYPFKHSFEELMLNVDIWYQSSWIALNRKKKVLQGYDPKIVYGDKDMKVEEPYEEYDHHQDDDEFERIADARMAEIERLRCVVRDQNEEIMVLKSLINRYFVLHVWADVEPSLIPVSTYASLITKAREMRKEDSEESSYYKLVILDGDVSISTYTNEELDGEEDTGSTVEEPTAPYYTKEEAEGKWVCAYDTICQGWDCVRHCEGEKDGLPFLYDSQEEVEKDDFFEPEDNFAIPATEFIEGRRFFIGANGKRVDGTPIVKGYKIEGTKLIQAEEPSAPFTPEEPKAWEEGLLLTLAWQSNDYYPDNVKQIRITLDLKQRATIIEAMKICKEHDDYFCIEVNACAEYLDEEGNVDDEFRADAERIRVYNNGCYFIAQSKYDAGSQIESEQFIVTPELFIHRPDHENN